jgi:hypothetical protein
VDEHEQPAFDETPRRIVSGTDPRRLYAVIAVLLGVIVVLAIRPWGDDAQAPASGDVAQATPATVDTPAGSDSTSSTPPSAGPEAVLDVTCGSPSGWRAATLQAWLGRSQPIRSWIAIEPVDATSALDPSIPFAPVATGVVTAIGYCAPLGDDERPPAVAVASLWALAGDHAIPLTLLPLEPATPDALGGLWLRPAEVTGDSVAGGNADLWPPGRYAIELASPGGDYHRWLGIEIADLAHLRAGSPDIESPGAGSPAAGSPAAGSPSVPAP